MSRGVDYAKLSVLVADDFSSFRHTVSGMLSSLGVKKIELASNAREAIQCCEHKFFDLILCDYNLGDGRTGQHVLEELRHRGLINRQTLFLIVSAESSRTIVLCAYDCEPDDFLMKPINARMLQQRIERLVRQRDALAPAMRALDAKEHAVAAQVLEQVAGRQTRHAVAAQKMLGTVLLSQGDLDRAEALYTRALEVRQLDWARLGLAQVRQARGDLDLAGEWLQKIVEENPMFLPAYDSLAENWNKRGDRLQEQTAVQKAVEISPLSILRQKYLAIVAQENADLVTAVVAQRRVVKLGRLSCYGAAEDHFHFARLVADAIEQELDLGSDIGTEAINFLKNAKDAYPLEDSAACSVHLLEGRLHALAGRKPAAQESLTEAEALMYEGSEDIVLEVDRMHALFALGENPRAEALLNDLRVIFADDQRALERLDVFLSEPASASNSALVADINREGIDLYNHGRFDEALACFDRARTLFPRHVGIHLNIVQSLVGKLKETERDQETVEECARALRRAGRLINTEHPQYTRFSRLKAMAHSAMGH
ncbi:tetratricopeptide repeat-containing response regulator [Teredinibacter turnerae]|uniref:tetratricopeptide repeat-containing response regulator n=1 Tax=Teredinibacter turnerae TaxID=2426 RepID=UPI0003A98DDB|nr:tetratricopeptide repeat-containing response regulator [Teredinibacter turnerae]